jgi:DNA processing protein
MGSPEAIFNASLTELESRRLPAAVARAIHTRQPRSVAAKELAQAQAAGIRLLTWDEPHYPQRLREIYDPPPLLYVLGNIELLNRQLISTVGSRRPTPCGNQMVEKPASNLADRGVVSGLAHGIDSCAHKGALSSLTGATIGVLGCGIDVIYPKENKKIFAEMEKRGAIISEFAMGTFPGPQNFPIRNRIISGMAVGVVVVAGAQCSGSLITAGLAMEIGREVYGVPGKATQPNSFGPNQLIKQGDKLGGRDRRASDAHPRRAFTDGNGLQRGKSAAGREGFGSHGRRSVSPARRGRIPPRGRSGRTFGAYILRSAGRPVRPGAQRRGRPVAREAIPQSPVVNNRDNCS